MLKKKENDEVKLPEDELPVYKRRPPSIDMSMLKDKPMGDFKKLSKKGKPLMLFATVSGEPTKEETESITALWQSSLFNANYEITRYIIEDNKAIFMLQDGGLAWEIKDFLVKQERCLEVTFDDNTYPGNNFPKSEKTEKKKSNKKSEF